MGESANPPEIDPRILNVVRSAQGHRGLPAMYEALRVFDPAALFDTLFAVSVLEQDGPHPVAFAGCALEALNPPCPLSPMEAVGRLLPSWDISLEEVVFYLARQFGAATILETAALLRSPSLTRTETVRLDTVAYWARVHQSKVSAGRAGAADPS